MSFRRIGTIRKLVLPIERRHQVCSPALKLLVSDNRPERNIQLREISINTRSYDKKPGLIQGFFQNLQIYFKKYRLRAAGFHLYESVADEVNYTTFMKVLRMPDTFTSWFLVTELHVWMLMAMLMADPKYGRFVRNCIVEAMWDDVKTRSKKLDEHTSIISSQIKTLSEEFQAALVNYDEGLLSNDTVLAGAIWRRLLMRNPSCTALDVEAMVKYIRQTMFHLDSWDLDTFLSKKKINWIPLNQVYDELAR